MVLCASLEEIDALVRRIYDASVEPEGWGDALTAVGDALGGCAIGMSIQGRERASGLFAQTRFDPDCTRVLVEQFADPSSNFMVAHASAMDAAAVRPRQTVRDDPGYFGSALYNEVFRPQGLAHAAMACAGRTADYYVPLGIFRRQQQEEFSKREVEIIDRVLPHVGRAVDITLKLKSANLRAGALEDALERLHFGVLIVDACCKVVHMNRTGAAIIAATQGLAVRSGSLLADNCGEPGRLHGLICRALSSVAFDLPPDGITIPRPGARPLSVAVAPASDAGPAWAAFAPCAVVFLTDPDRELLVSERLLHELFSLSPAQARLATYLARGLSLDEAARSLGIAIGTARAHLKQVFLRTQTGRQSELVALILNSAASLLVEERAT